MLQLSAVLNKFSKTCISFLQLNLNKAAPTLVLSLMRLCVPFIPLRSCSTLFYDALNLEDINTDMSR